MRVKEKQHCTTLLSKDEAQRYKNQSRPEGRAAESLVMTDASETMFAAESLVERTARSVLARHGHDVAHFGRGGHELGRHPLDLGGELDPAVAAEERVLVRGLHDPTSEHAIEIHLRRAAGEHLKRA